MLTLRQVFDLAGKPNVALDAAWARAACAESQERTMTDLESQALSIIRDCQKILADYLPPEGGNSDPKETISKLLGILDGPRVRDLTK